MATYLHLPPVRLTATADTTGRNPGNWTALFPQSLYRINVAQFELSHVSITGGTAGAFVQLLVGTYTYGGTPINSQQGILEYDPTNPPIIIPGQDIAFLFGNSPTGSTPAPVVTTFFRFDLDIPANRNTWEA